MCAAYNKAQGAGLNDNISMCTVTTTSTCKSHCPASTLCMVSFIACNVPYSPYACVPNAVHCMPCFVQNCTFISPAACLWNPQLLDI